MHFEILIEDQSGKKMIEHLMPQVITPNDSFRVHAYRGIGRIPTNLNKKADPAKRAMLNNLPRILTGYGKAFAGYSARYPAYVLLICDLDNRDEETFRSEITNIFWSSAIRALLQ